MMGFLFTLIFMPVLGFPLFLVLVIILALIMGIAAGVTEWWIYDRRAYIAELKQRRGWDHLFAAWRHKE
jgi:hypothetical protein